MFFLQQASHRAMHESTIIGGKPTMKHANELDAVAPIVGLTRERENSPEFPVQQPRRTTPSTTSRTTNIRPARKQRREVDVSESGEEQVEPEQAEEYAVRKSGRQRNQPKQYGFTNLISKLPVWLVAMLMIIMIPETHAIRTRNYSDHWTSASASNSVDEKR
ncbi:hypothetical protein BV898_05475 [Hypsibius exemplaris]|uniref:Uncharacterized protein n=1 Tax=Hypsibius exemplaris TaxID=2072580 RepID=A0A1W0WZ03_HYPEX|nr:hypothetical protein BV898_05475 [Hypsibius exemplaris]